MNILRRFNDGGQVMIDPETGLPINPPSTAGNGTQYHVPYTQGDFKGSVYDHGLDAIPEHYVPSPNYPYERVDPATLAQVVPTEGEIPMEGEFSNYDGLTSIPFAQEIEGHGEMMPPTDEINFDEDIEGDYVDGRMSDEERYDIRKKSAKNKVKEVRRIPRKYRKNGELERAKDELKNVNGDFEVFDHEIEYGGTEGEGGKLFNPETGEYENVNGITLKGRRKVKDYRDRVIDFEKGLNRAGWVKGHNINGTDLKNLEKYTYVDSEGKLNIKPSVKELPKRMKQIYDAINNKDVTFKLNKKAQAFEEKYGLKQHTVPANEYQSTSYWTFDKSKLKDGKIPKELQDFLNRANADANQKFIEDAQAHADAVDEAAFYGGIKDVRNGDVQKGMLKIAGGTALNFGGSILGGIGHNNVLAEATRRVGDYKDGVRILNSGMTHANPRYAGKLGAVPLNMWNNNTSLYLPSATLRKGLSSSIQARNRAGGAWTTKDYIKRGINNYTEAVDVPAQQLDQYFNLISIGAKNQNNQNDYSGR